MFGGPQQNAVNEFESVCALLLSLPAVSLILVSFIRAVLLQKEFGIKKALRICAVLLVAPILIAMQVVCTSTVVSKIYREVIKVVRQLGNTVQFVIGLVFHRVANELLLQPLQPDTGTQWHEGRVIAVRDAV